MLTIFNCLFSTLKTIYGQVICLIWNRRRICNTIEKNKERKCDLLDLESERYLQYDWVRWVIDNSLTRLLPSPYVCWRRDCC